MDPTHLSNQEKLDHMFEMITELNEEMHNVKRRQAIGTAFKLIYMLLVVCAMGIAYYFLSPLLIPLFKAQDKIVDTLNSLDKYKALMNTADSPMPQGQTETATPTAEQEQTQTITVTPEMIRAAREMMKKNASGTQAQ